MNYRTNTPMSYGKGCGNRKPGTTQKQIDTMVRDHLLELTRLANLEPPERRRWGSMHSVCHVEMREVAKALGISWRKIDVSMTRLSIEQPAVITKTGPYYSLAQVDHVGKSYVMGWDLAKPSPPSNIGKACFVWNEEIAPKKKRYSKRLQRRIE